MKRLTLITAACMLSAVYSTTALATETAEAANEAADATVTGILPGEEGNPADVADPTTDTAAPEEVPASANKRSAKNAIYLDLAGPGGLYSLNYDRMITDELSARIGFSYISAGGSASSGGTTTSAEVSLLTIPITVSYLGIGSLSNQFELGGGATFMRVTGDGFISAGSDSSGASASATVIGLTPMAGYRHQAPDGGFVFRIGLSPLVMLGGEGGVLPWGYLSLGAGF